jgi:hypothetical protein
MTSKNSHKYGSHFEGAERLRNLVRSIGRDKRSTRTDAYG